MRRTLAAGLVAGVVTTTASPCVRRFLLRRGLVDIPNHRSSHKRQTPRGGGLACALGAAAGALVVGQRSAVPANTVVGITALTALGWADDYFRGLPTQLRLLVQAWAGLLLTDGPPAARVVTSLGTVSTVNAVNFMDGSNGITCSTMAASSLNTLILGRNAYDPRLQTLGALTLGTSLGFLPWNAPKAALFLGDVGSYFFGAMIAATVAPDPSRGRQVALLSPLVLYMVDTSLTLARRAARGEIVTEAHRDHIYQRLISSSGRSHMEVAAVHAAASLLIGMTWRSSHSDGLKVVVTAAVAGLYASLPYLDSRINGCHSIGGLG